jgi:hypothetical protein
MTIPFYRADLANVGAAEMRRRIPDLTERIVRQRARLQTIKLAGTGPSVEMEALLGDMIARRDAMQARLADIEAEAPAQKPAPIKLRLVPRATAAFSSTDVVVEKGWRVELSCGRVSLQKPRSGP